MKALRLHLFLLIFLPLLSASATDIPSGPVSGHWYSSGNPYNILGDIEILVDSTLWIHEGVNVIFRGDYSFSVRGKIKALGSYTDSIKFGGGNSMGEWDGISLFEAPDTSIFEYCFVSAVNPNGGAIGAFTSNPVIRHCTLITAYQSFHSVGGAFSCSFGADPIVENCTLIADSCHGVFSYVAGYPIFRNCDISGNSGCGLFFNYSLPTLENCVIHGFDGWGGLSFNSTYEATISNCIITDNHSYYSSSMIYMELSNVTIQNSIIWGNSTAGGPQVYIGFYGYPSTLTISNSVLEGGRESVFVDCTCTLNWGAGMIDEDPLFTTGAFSNYHLGLDSPCIDAGDPDILYNDPEDPLNPGYALQPAQGMVRNDMGIYGGPGTIDWIVGIEDTHDPTLPPSEFVLYPNYPNPFNASTTIHFDLPVTCWVRLVVFDIGGRQVNLSGSGTTPTTELVDGWREAGRHEVTWNAAGLPSGVYVVRLEAEDFAAVQKIVLMK
ncbi:MAG: right-handed parallel beta-helix repeat-containing protein [Planctomycetota bacterium]